MASSIRAILEQQPVVDTLLKKKRWVNLKGRFGRAFIDQGSTNPVGEGDGGGVSESIKQDTTQSRKQIKTFDNMSDWTQHLQKLGVEPTMGGQDKAFHAAEKDGKTYGIWRGQRGVGHAVVSPSDAYEGRHHFIADLKESKTSAWSSDIDVLRNHGLKSVDEVLSGLQHVAAGYSHAFAAKKVLANRMGEQEPRHVIESSLIEAKKPKRMKSELDIEADKIPDDAAEKEFGDNLQHHKMVMIQHRNLSVAIDKALKRNPKKDWMDDDHPEVTAAVNVRNDFYEKNQRTFVLAHKINKMHKRKATLDRYAGYKKSKEEYERNNRVKVVGGTDLKERVI